MAAWVVICILSAVWNALGVVRDQREEREFGEWLHQRNIENGIAAKKAQEERAAQMEVEHTAQKVEAERKRREAFTEWLRDQKPARPLQKY